MFGRIRRALAQDVRTVLVAVVAASAVSGPAAAAAVYVANADKVDNKHAVGSGATVTARKGKLVATSATTGRLPNNIIAVAPNSNLLDGKDSSAFLASAGKAADADKLDGIDSSALSTKAELSAAGALNSAGNPVSWTKLKGVPSTLADGDDAGQGMFHGTQFSGTIAGSASQTFFTFGWSKTYTMVWQAVPTTPGGRVSTSVVIEDGGSAFTYWITVKNELATAVNYDARYTVIPR
jgi:hypothetical protein